MNILALTLIFFLAGANQTFFQFKNQMENLVKDVALTLESVYNPSPDASQKCLDSRQIYYDNCQGGDQGICYENFPKHNKCFGEGVYMSEHHVYQFPISVDKNNPNQEEYEFICRTNQLESTFQELRNIRNRNFATIYVGSPSGIFVYHPGTKQGDFCRSFETRVRPWYNAAATGFKNVIVFFKIKSNKEKAIQFGQYFNNITKTTDWTMVVDINACQRDEICFEEALSTTYYKTQIQTNFSNLQLKQSWTRQSYSIIKQHMEYFFQRVPPSQRNMVILITDDLPNPIQIQTKINQLPEYDLRLFPIILGNSEADLTQLKEAACNHKGLLVQSLQNNDYIPDLMKEFSVYLSEGLEINKPIWSPIYEDALEYGTVVTVAMPVYKNSPYKRLVGVIGLDVTLNFLRESLGMYDVNFAYEFFNLISYSSEVDCNCSICRNSELDEHNENIAFSWQQGEQEERTCCGIEQQAFVATISTVSVVVFLIIVGVIAFCIWKKRKRDAEKATQRGTDRGSEKDIIPHPLANLQR